MDNTKKQKYRNYPVRKFFLGLIIVALITLVSGAIQGKVSNRWGPPTAMSDAAEKLEKLPKQFGDWESCDERRLDKETEQMLECTGHVSRRYVNQKTGEQVSIIVLVGPAGPISVHTPEICFSSREYKAYKTREVIPVDDENQLWGLNFRSIKLEAEQLVVYYGWSTGQKWVAADDARYDFAGAPYLYKIQLAGNVPLGSTGKSTDVCHTFLHDFLPELQKYLIDPKKH